MRSHDAAQFVAAIEKSSQGGSTVVTTIEGFAGEPEALYVALDSPITAASP